MHASLTVACGVVNPKCGSNIHVCTPHGNERLIGAWRASKRVAMLCLILFAPSTLLFHMIFDQLLLTKDVVRYIFRACTKWISGTAGDHRM